MCFEFGTVKLIRTALSSCKHTFALETPKVWISCPWVLSGTVLPLFLFHFPVSFAFTVFHVAFGLAVTMLAAAAVRHCAAEVVLMLDLLTILGLLLPLKLHEARQSLITIIGVAMSSLVVRRTPIKKDVELPDHWRGGFAA